MTPMPDPPWRRSSSGGPCPVSCAGVELLLIRHALPVRRELDEGIADPELSPRRATPRPSTSARYLADERSTPSTPARCSGPTRPPRPSPRLQELDDRDSRTGSPSTTATPPGTCRWRS